MGRDVPGGKKDKDDILVQHLYLNRLLQWPTKTDLLGHATHYQASNKVSNTIKIPVFGQAKPIITRIDTQSILRHQLAIDYDLSSKQKVLDFMRAVGKWVMSPGDNVDY